MVVVARPGLAEAVEAQGSPGWSRSCGALVDGAERPRRDHACCPASTATCCAPIWPGGAPAGVRNCRFEPTLLGATRRRRCAHARTDPRHRPRDLAPAALQPLEPRRPRPGATPLMMPRPLDRPRRSRRRCCGCSSAIHDDRLHAGRWSIIVLTFIVRTALVPLTVKQQQSMRRMTALQPELKKLQAKYKHDRADAEREDDGVLPGEQHEPVRVVPPDRRADPDLHRPVLPAAQPGAVHRARRRPVVPVRLGSRTSRRT